MIFWGYHKTKQKSPGTRIFIFTQGIGGKKRRVNWCLGSFNITIYSTGRKTEVILEWGPLYYHTYFLDMCRIPRCIWSPDWKFEWSPRFEAFLSTRGGRFLLILPPPCPPAWTTLGKGLHGGLLESSCGRRRRRGMPNHQNVGEPAYLFQNTKRSYPKAVRQISAASSSFSANQCFEKRNYVSLKTRSSTKGERVHSPCRPACPPSSTALGRVCPTAYPMIRAGGVGPWNV